MARFNKRDIEFDDAAPEHKGEPVDGRIANALDSKLSKSEIANWFRGAVWNEHDLTLTCKSEFFAARVHQQYGAELADWLGVSHVRILGKRLAKPSFKYNYTEISPDAQLDDEQRKTAEINRKALERFTKDDAEFISEGTAMRNQAYAKLQADKERERAKDALAATAQAMWQATT